MDIQSLRLVFFDGNMFNSTVSYMDDVTPTGDVSTGDFSFTLPGVSVSKTGVYEFYGPSLKSPLSCVSYIY